MTPGARRRLAAGVAFAAGLAVWTWKLLEPNPAPETMQFLSWWAEWAPYLAAKALHVTAYATLTAAGQLAVRPRYRLWVAGVMVTHGAATEVGQTYVPNRHGCRQDVAIDSAGVAAGTLLLRRVTRDRPAADADRPAV